jgi:uncharacterized damage-inducible protein DinB
MLPETAAVIRELNELWAEARQMVQDAAPQMLTYKPGDGFNSISAIITHITASQKWWIGEVLAGRDMHRDRDAEFRTAEADPAALVKRIDEAEALVSEVLKTVTAEMADETRLYRGRPVTTRWILMRVLAHTARHLGQIQIIRKIWGLGQAERIG